MRWTPDLIRQKADAMERRIDRAATITPETMRLVVEALRFYAAEGFAARDDGYTIEVWDARAGTIVERLGEVAVLAVAEAVYDLACAARPGRHVTLRKRAWVLREQPAGEAGQGT